MEIGIVFTELLCLTTGFQGKEIFSRKRFGKGYPTIINMYPYMFSRFGLLLYLNQEIFLIYIVNEAEGNMMVALMYL